jgi:sortase A
LTVQRVVSEDASNQHDHLRIDAWALCNEFVEWLVSEAHGIDADEHRGDHPDVDWDSIWQAGDGAPSDELAIGRVIRAASAATRGMARAFPVTPPSPVPTNGAGAPLAAISTEPREPGDDVDVSAERAAAAADVAESSAVDTQPVADPPRQAPAVVEPISTAAPATEPLVTPPGEAASLAATPPRSLITAPVDAPLTEEVPTVVPAVVRDDLTDSRPDHAIAGTTQEAPEHSAWYHVFTWMRNIGVIVLLFVAWQLWGTAISQHHAQNQLKAQFDAAIRTHHPPVPTTAGSLIPASTSFAPPADGSVVARLQIPAIGVDQYVVEGTSSDDLAKGPGHYLGTALPGQAGNVAIAGHRTTHGAPFNGLGHLVSGDRIILTTTWGERLTYIVSGTPQAVSPADVGVLNYFGDDRITLTTCNPEYSSSQRLIAVGKLHKPAAPATLPTHIRYHVANSDTASWDWSLLPTVGIEICLLLLLALSYRRFDVWFGPRTKWIILVPLWAAGVYLLFGSLTTLLPSSI